MEELRKRFLGMRLGFQNAIFQFFVDNLDCEIDQVEFQ